MIGDEVYLTSTSLYYTCAKNNSDATFTVAKWTLTDPTTTESFGFHYVQSADVMYIAHVDVHPQKLSRVADDDWTMVDVDFQGGPFKSENIDTADTLTFTHYTGAHITTENSAALIVAASTFVAGTLVGYI